MNTAAQLIPFAEIEPVNLSAVDRSGMVFRWQGGFYRALSAESAPFYSALFRDGTLRKLMERQLLVESELTPLRLEGYASVVRHHEIEFISQPYEWCGLMLQDAVLGVLDLLDELAKEKLTLKDGHLFNSLFDGCRPVHVDLTSIVPSESSATWPAMDEFRERCVHPLFLCASGCEKLAAMFMYEEIPISAAEVSVWCRPRAGGIRSAARDLGDAVEKRLKRAIRSRLPGGHRESVLQQLRNEVASLQFPAADAADSDNNRAPRSREASHAREKLIQDWLDSTRPRSLLDLGSGPGRYALMAAATGCKVIAFDKDPAQVAALYRAARKAELPILPLVMDFARPTPSRGPLGFWSTAASERLRCDAVIAIDLLDELLSGQRMNCEGIAAGMAEYSRKQALIEFPAFDVSGAPFLPEQLVSALQKEFRTVRRWNDEDLHGAAFYLCEK